MAAPLEIKLFWFMIVTLVAVAAAVAAAVLGRGGTLPEVEPDRTSDALPQDRPVGRRDIEGLRLPMVPRGYRMADVDDVLDRLGAELAHRDARIAELEARLAGVAAGAVGAARAAEEAGPPGAGPQEPEPAGDDPHGPAGPDAGNTWGRP